MAYEVIARRWRPQHFDAVVGQAHVTTTLRNALRLSRLAHAYLFVGPRGVGKTSTARILAKAVNCLNLGDTGQPCDTCDNCVAIRGGTALDVVEIDAASNNSVDDIRELRERVRFPPAVAQRKVYVIDEVHMLSTAAFNAFLKTLEEPPDHCLFIMATTEAHKIPATILSRCQRFDFRRITTRDIADRLQQICDAADLQVPYEDGLLLEIARAGDGSMRDAESLLDQVIACGEQAVTAEATELVLGSVSLATLRDVVAAIAASDAPAVLHHIATIAASGKDLHQFVRDLAAYARNLMVATETGDVTLVDLGAEDAAAVLEQAQALPPGLALRMMDTFVQLDGRFRYATSGRIALELAALKLARWGGDVKASDVIEKIAALEGKFTGDSPAPTGGPAAGSPSAAPRSTGGAARGTRGSAPRSAPTAAAPQIPGDGSLWSNFLGRLKDVKRPAYFHAANGTLGTVDDRTVQILLPEVEGYNKDYLTSKAVLPVLEQVAAQVWGGPRRVEILMATPGAVPAPQAATADDGHTGNGNTAREDATTSPNAATPEAAPGAAAPVAAEPAIGPDERAAVLEDPMVQQLIAKFEGRVVNIQDAPPRSGKGH